MYLIDYQMKVFLPKMRHYEFKKKKKVLDYYVYIKQTSQPSSLYLY